MSQQLQITGGAKVRDLNDVIIGTSGVLSSLAFNVANGVPKLDSNAKILVSQLPNSVMEYQGTWNANTNTPTLTNGGAFNQGDVYLCNVAGTTNFGAGPISFIVGDSAIYSGSIWQRSGGATGSVTSVGLSTDGNSITIGSSPITTSGTITANFAGTNLQYINGAGNLTTFPTLISSIGLSMPSAFSVANSPLTANGTIAVTGAGYPSQYIRGDGTLADFPTSGGGGSSVSYYLNGGTSQGTIGGVTYYEMSKTADTGTGVDFPKTGDGLIVSFLTDANDPAQLNIPAGNWNYEIYASMSSNGGTPQLYAELYVYNGTTFTLISTSSNEILYDGVNLNLYTFAMTVPSTTLALTDRLAIKLYATNSGGKTTTVHTQDSHLCQVITTFSTGITALNGLTAQVQYFATGTSGTDFNISSATATHTFNIPDASATNRGLITTGSQTIAGAKTFSSGVTSSSFYAQGNGTQGGYLYLKQGITPYSTLTGANSITADGTKYIFFSDAGSSNGKIALFELGSLTNNTNRTYTLPDASGTLALLESTQTFSGYKTFSNGLVASVLESTSGIILSTTIQVTPSSPSIAICGTPTGLEYRTATNVNSLVFQAANYTYTFPAATGTIALGTGITNYHAKWTGTNTIGNSLIWDNGTNVGIGNTNTSYTLDVSGTGRFTSTLLVSGASTLTGNVGIGANLLSWYSSGYTALQIGGMSGLFSNTSNTSITGSLTLGYNIYVDSAGNYQYMNTTSARAGSLILMDGGNISFQNAVAATSANPTLTPRMTITSGGNVGIGTSTVPAKLTIYTGVGGAFPATSGTTQSNGLVARYKDTSNACIDYGTNGGSGGWLQVTNITDLSSAYPFLINPNGGNVLIGTTSDSGYPLQVNALGTTSQTAGLCLFRDSAGTITHYIFSASDTVMNTQNASIWLKRNSSTTRSINASGTINASGADYAEYMVKAIEDNIVKGDIVGVDINGLLTNIFADAISFVVKSTDPSYVGGDTWFNVEPPLQSQFATKAEFDIAYVEFERQSEEARAKVDRIAFSGQVPCNVLNAQVGDYIIPTELDGKISGQAITNPTFEQYQLSVGKVWKIMEDGRAWIAVKIG
jgi:hypothetical protein